MKSIALLFCGILVITTHLDAQLFGFLKKPERITIYGLNIKSSQVGNGTKKFSGGGESFYWTELLDNPPVIKISSDFLRDMGTYRKNYEDYTQGNNPLFNLSFDRNPYPLLDTIDMDFYRTFGLDKLTRRSQLLKDNPTFKKIRDVIVDSLTWTTKKKKDYLFTKEFDDIREQLILTRLDTSAHPFKIDKKKVSMSTVKLKAVLDKIIVNNGIEASAGLYAYIHNLADENVKVIGNYYNSQFDENYISKVEYFFSTIPTFDTQFDQFSFWLKKYIESNIAAANSELVAIRIIGAYDRTKINSDSISFDLATKFQIPKDKANKIAVDLTVAFSKNEVETVSSTFNTVYVLRYFTTTKMDELIFQPLKNNLASKFK